MVVSGEGRGSARDVGSTRGVVLAALGVAFLLVGTVDLALLWIPAHFDTLSWEFATVGRTLDGLPLAILGLGLLTYGATRSPRAGRGRARAFAAAFTAAALLVAAMGLLFVTALPTVLQQTGAEALEGVRRAAIRHGVQIVVYPASFALIAAVLWRGGRGGS